MSARQVLALALSDLTRTLRSRESLLWLLIMPLPFTFFFGLAFRSAPAAPTRVVVVAAEPDAGSEAVAAALVQAGYAVERAPAWTGPGELPRAGYRVDLPARLGQRLVAAEPLEVALWSRRGDPEAGRLEALLQRVLWTARADLLVALVEGGSRAWPTSDGPAARRESRWSAATGDRAGRCPPGSSRRCPATWSCSC